GWSDPGRVLRAGPVLTPPRGALRGRRCFAQSRTPHPKNIPTPSFRDSILVNDSIRLELIPHANELYRFVLRQLVDPLHEPVPIHLPRHGTPMLVQRLQILEDSLDPLAGRGVIGSVGVRGC